ncbi:class I SAM-dependent DNA methyltransferase (plasmid) [Rathayibacter sp. VKM Ac-2759]|uniref:DNA methyltransferase n=1 Tax=Rathayibacter sp. VKM Ac-2759 TaxID=2609252 RepID=UPI001315E615|nr:DNA methyltransferase [Rathayibacter sp. VKM Ac-2759]QHC68910.1 class I SAM-dependent DNA methyltransferase [Rathayibacter sp. VKM Ac-2759]
MNEAKLLAFVDNQDLRELFITELGWNNPDQPDCKFEVEGHAYSLTQIAGYKGLRIWFCAELPARRIQRTLDELIGQNSHERLVIFADDRRQEWRWPRRAQLGGANAKLLVHRHIVGEADAHMAKQLSTIAIDFDEDISLVELLTKMRAAFDEEAQQASVKAARLMSSLYTWLVEANYNEHEATLFLARLLFVLFADDSNMWSRDIFLQFLVDDTDDAELHLRLTELFLALDTPKNMQQLPPESPLTKFPYVNGGLYAERLELRPLPAEFRRDLIAACHFDWSLISPAVFGSMFQTVKSKEARRSGGEHYTTEENILRTIEPLFLNDLRNRLIENWDSIAGLNRLQTYLGSLRFLDPACGCGNFLIVAYRELRALELDLIVRRRELDLASGTDRRYQGTFDVTGDIRVTLDHFFGIEIDEWPARIAEVAMLLMDHLANQRMAQDFGVAPDRLPISIAPKILHANALREDWKQLVGKADDVLIFGNPPYLGHKERSAAQTADMKVAWGKLYFGYLDFVTSWHAKCLVFFAGTKRAKFAFVTTNSIVQGFSVSYLFGPLFADGWRIRFAHRPFAWTSEAPDPAGVHTVIVGFDKERSTPQLFTYERPNSKPVEVTVDRISPYLIDASDVVVVPRNQPLSEDMGVVSSGSNPIDFGHLIFSDATKRVIEKDPIARKYIRKFANGDEFINGKTRWCLWLRDADPSDLTVSPILRERVNALALDRAASDRAATKRLANLSGLFGEDRQPVAQFVAFPQTFSEHRKYCTVGDMQPDTVIGMKLYSSADPDGTTLAIASSSLFADWQQLVGGRLESRLSFSINLVWNNYPLPRLSSDDRRSLVNAAQAIKEARHNLPEMSLSEMYKEGLGSEELLRAHMSLDRLTFSIFRLDPYSTLLERQRHLLSRYAQMTHR